MKLTITKPLAASQILVLCGLLVLSGCASIGPLRNDVLMQTESGAGVIIQTATARTTERGVMIAGTVRRAFGYGPSYRSHLDIEVMAPDGSIQKQVATRYIPFPIPQSLRFRRHSDYAVELPLTPARGSTIRVTHHPIGIQGCPYHTRPRQSRKTRTGAEAMKKSIWKERTSLVQNGESIPRLRLWKASMLACVIAHPFFGKKFAIRALWTNGMAPEQCEERTEIIKHSKLVFVDHEYDVTSLIS